MKYFFHDNISPLTKSPQSLMDLILSESLHYHINDYL